MALCQVVVAGAPWAVVAVEAEGRGQGAEEAAEAGVSSAVVLIPTPVSARSSPSPRLAAVPSPCGSGGSAPLW